MKRGKNEEVRALHQPLLSPTAPNKKGYWYVSVVVGGAVVLDGLDVSDRLVNDKKMIFFLSFWHPFHISNDTIQER